MLSLAGLPLYCQNPVGRLYEHPDGYAIVDYNAGARNMHEFQALLGHLDQLLKRRNWQKILSNQRLLSPFTQEENNWVRDQWLAARRANGQGLVVATLLANDVFTRLATTSLMTEAQESFQASRAFNDAETAAAWLRKKL